MKEGKKERRKEGRKEEIMEGSEKENNVRIDKSS